MIPRASIGLILAALLAAPAQAADLRLTVTGIRSDGGELLIGLYDNPEGYAHAIANASSGRPHARSGTSRRCVDQGEARL